MQQTAFDIYNVLSSVIKSPINDKLIVTCLLFSYNLQFKTVGLEDERWYTWSALNCFDVIYRIQITYAYVAESYLQHSQKSQKV